ncbi:hypothetical protein BASA60_004235 [Batrachochytrium salamandrivorans]|nr:hypothetical protein BASA60_004235 [Batrachochytrium salamandrivorans]
MSIDSTIRGLGCCFCSVAAVAALLFSRAVALLLLPNRLLFLLSAPPSSWQHLDVFFSSAALSSVLFFSSAVLPSVPDPCEYG